MACKECDFKGYVETYYHAAADARPMLSQCRVCKDIEAYSRRVQQLRGVEYNDSYRAIGRKSPFIGRELRITHKGLEITSKPDSERKKGEPCPVVPFKRG